MSAYGDSRYGDDEPRRYRSVYVLACAQPLKYQTDRATQSHPSA